jgi:hypothetical protein
VTDRKPHPSGKPIRRPGIKMLGFARRPHDEPLTPGLRRQEGANAIGFMPQLSSDGVDDD